ncbi:hypothetical protein JCM11491_006112 [Sporobolomyces phaffii]
MQHRPCLDLARNGECLDQEYCGLNHDLPFCPTCDRYFDSENSYRIHVLGGPHRAQLDRVDTEVIPLPDGKVQCKFCKSKIDPNRWDRHVRSPKHLAKASFQRARDATAVAEADKFNVEISPEGNVDFGLLEFEEMTAQTAAHQPTKYLEVATTEAGIKLESVRFRESSQPSAGRRHFSVQSFPKPLKLTPGRSLKVSVHFQPRNDIGSYEEILVLSFAASLGGGQHETFSIQRTIRGSVGIKADVERFSAKKPYVKPELRNRPRADEKNTVAAPKDEFKQNVPWTGKLPWFRVPPWIASLVETKTIGEVVRALRQSPGALSYQNYQKFWSTLLYVEALQEEIDVRRYDINNTTLKKDSGVGYYLDVEGLAEKRPSVLRSDKIKVQTRTSSDKTWYEGIVTVVEESRVLLKFAKSFKPEANARFDVQFSSSRIPTRRQLQALAAPLPRSQLLFPSLDVHYSGPIDVNEHGRFFSSAIAANHAQKQAVVSIFNNTSGKAPYVVFGPPGTGKTVTIIEACQQLVKYLDATILLAAPSNSAADLLCTRLNLPSDVVFRLNAPSRMRDEVSPAVMEFSHIEDGSFSCPEVTSLSKYRVIVTTCISASILREIGLKQGHFSHIFIDEAGQATEPEAFLPLSLAAKGTSVVLAGDPKQLGPIVRSPVVKTLGLETSLLERLMTSPQYDQNSPAYRGITYTKLVQNYRNHRAILDTSNREFYANELRVFAPTSVTGALQGWEGWRNSDFPIIFHSVKGRDEREGTSPSFFNVAEISMVRHYVESLKKSKRVRVADSDIGIISPYSAQCAKLRVALKQHVRPNLTIGSVEQFQGSERSVILMSTVRSNKEFLEQDKRFAIGFVGNEKRFNVAVTRPQAGLIVVGDPDVLTLDPLWRRFLVYVHKNGGWRGQDWDRTPFEDPSFDPVESARSTIAMTDLTSRFGALVNLGMDE